MAVSEMPMSPEEKTESKIAAIWRRTIPLMQERLSLLERAAGQATASSLGEEEQRAAREIAHKMAGSLGMFGFMEGTLAARALEVLLQEHPVPGSRMSELVNRLRVSIFPQG